LPEAHAEVQPIRVAPPCHATNPLDLT